MYLASNMYQVIMQGALDTFRQVNEGDLLAKQIIILNHISMSPIRDINNAALGLHFPFLLTKCSFRDSFPCLRQLTAYN